METAAQFNRGGSELHFASVPSWRSAGFGNRHRRFPLPLLAAVLLLAAPSIGADVIATSVTETVALPTDAGALESSTGPAEATAVGPGATSPSREDRPVAEPADVTALPTAKPETGSPPAGATAEPALVPKIEAPAQPTVPLAQPGPEAAPAETRGIGTVNLPPDPGTTDAAPSAALPAAPAATYEVPTVAPATPVAEDTPAAAAKIAPLKAAQPRWVPLDVGNQWTYVYLRERSRSHGDSEPETERFRGTLVERVVGNVPGAVIVEPRGTSSQSTPWRLMAVRWPASASGCA